MEEKGTMHVHLLTELTGNLYSEESEWEEEWSESDEYGMPLDGTELADYEEVTREELERYGEDDLMQYFNGSESIQGKIQSAVVTIENKDGILYGCTKLELNELLSQEELQEFTEYITGQYSDGWGEGFEQRDIEVDGGINLSTIDTVLEAGANILVAGSAVFKGNIGENISGLEERISKWR